MQLPHPLPPTPPAPVPGAGARPAHGPGTAPAAPRGRPGRRLAAVLGLTLAFAGVEAAGGVLSGSLALLADAGHMLTDASAIGVSLFALWLSRRDPSDRHTYGFRRAEFLAAFVNAIGLLALAAWIVAEAVERIGAPRPVLAGLMLWVALAGLAVNLVGILLLRGHSHGNLSLRSALWHLVGDLLGSLGAVSAALVIALTGWTPIDPLLSVGIAVLIGLGGARILYDSASLLMDRAPAAVDTAEVAAYLASLPEVREVCDLHIWCASSRETMLTAHLVVAPEVDRDRFLHALLRTLQARFGLAHLTIQMEGRPHES
ncbi:MAG TPA: cation diffusion facilitator family transporter, partial [bacterium]